MNQLRDARLRNELKRLRRLARRSSHFAIESSEGEPPEVYVLRFEVTTMVKEGLRIHQFDGPTLVQICLPDDYPRVAPLVVILQPHNIFHPNVHGPMICLGTHLPSVWLDETCWRIAHVLAYRSFTMNESQSLNPEACMWARHNQELFPTDQRPFCDRKAMQIEVW